MEMQRSSLIYNLLLIADSYSYKLLVVLVDKYDMHSSLYAGCLSKSITVLNLYIHMCIYFQIGIIWYFSVDHTSYFFLVLSDENPSH